MPLDRKELSEGQPVWLLRDEQIAPFKVHSTKDDYLVLETLSNPPRFMPYTSAGSSLHASEKDARVELIKIFEEDIEIRQRRLSAAKASLNQHLRGLESASPAP